MYPVHSTWLAEQMTDRPRDPRRHHPLPLWARPRPEPRPRREDILAVRRPRPWARVQEWVWRTSLGPLPTHCASDPAGPRW